MYKNSYVNTKLIVNENKIATFIYNLIYFLK